MNLIRSMQKKTLEYIEQYIAIKEKFNLEVKNLNFLKGLANKLKSQFNIRLDNSNNCSLFVLKVKNNSDKYFISESSLYEYLSKHHIQNVEKIIKV